MDQGLRQNLTSAAGGAAAEIPTATGPAGVSSSAAGAAAAVSSASSSAALPLVSVVVPCYNMEAYVADTLRSVLASSYPALEIIVVDDGSTDGTVGIVEQLAATHPQLSLYQQANAGPARARNHAVGRSRGRYLLPLDADDLISPTFIAAAVAVLEARPEVSVVTPAAEKFGAKQGPWPLPEFSRSLLAQRNILHASSMFRRCDFDRVGGYCETIPAREDWEFWIHLLKAGGQVVRLPEVGFYYRIRPNSKRIQDRRRDRAALSVLNERHADFFARELGGPLRRMRSWSRFLNRLLRLMGRLS